MPSMQFLDTLTENLSGCAVHVCFGRDEVVIAQPEKNSYMVMSKEQGKALGWLLLDCLERKNGANANADHI